MTGAFRWPPKDAAPDPAPAPTSSPPPSIPRPRTLWRELESLWLAPEAPTLEQRITEAGWSPDPLGAWCDRCGATVGPYEESEFGCSACRGRPVAWDRAVRLGEHTGELRGWIHELKFTRFRPLGIGLGRALGRRLRSCGLPENDLIICPVPTTWRRRTARGIDHAGAIAAGVAGELEAPVKRLLRRRHRPSQQSLPASQRRRNVAGAFARRERVDVAGKLVVIVDDVMTTGATARAACLALRRGLRPDARPTAIWTATLAVAPRPGAEP